MKKDKFITDFEDIPTPRQKMPHLSLEDRLNFKEVELGFSEEVALKETSRCLSCRRCIGCGLCLAECDQQAIVYDQKSETMSLNVDSIVVATGAENFDARRKPELGYSSFPNVITSMEMERILSANGPYGGILMRPSDGVIPQRIAFIQCVGSRDESLGQNYCSNICCVTALKQSMAAVDRIEGAEITIFYSDFRPFTNDGEQYFLKAKQEKTISFVRANVAQVDQTDEGNNLIVKFARNDSEETGEYDLVVLSTGIVPTAGIKRLSRQFGVRLNKYGFFPAEEQSPTASSGEGVWFAGTMTHPADIESSLNQARAVAAKVLQSLKEQDKLRETVQENNGKFEEKTIGNRVGVFVCRYGLSTQFNIDVDDVIRSLKGNDSDVFVDDLEYCCNSTGKKRIRSAIETEKLGRAIIAPCYPNSNGAMFQKTIATAGLPPENLTIFSSEPNNQGRSTEDVKNKIMELASNGAEMNVGVASPKISVKEACVIGGSAEAVQTALEIADMGFKAHLICEDENILTNESGLFWHVPGIEKLTESLREKTLNHPRLDVHAESSVTKFNGKPGDYTLTINDNRAEKSIQSGAVVLAPGAKAFSPNTFFYGEKNNVITQRELSQKITDNAVNSKNVVMIQCVGSRDANRSYCSRVCCEQAIQNALKIKEHDNNISVTILHRDIRVHDFEEDNYTEALELGVKFIRMDSYPKIEPENDTLKIDVLDRLSNKNISLDADLLVLSAGMEPRDESEDLAAIFNLPLSRDGLLQKDGEMTQSDQDRLIIKTGLAVQPRRLGDVLTEATAAAGQICLLFRNG